MRSNHPASPKDQAIAIVRDEQQRQDDPLVQSLLERIANRINNETLDYAMPPAEFHELYCLAGERFDHAGSDGAKAFWADLQDQVGEWVKAREDSDPPSDSQ